MNIKRTRDMVETALKHFPELRNSDIALVIHIWKEHFRGLTFTDSDGDTCIKLKNLFKLPTHESVKRLRADFNHNGIYYPTRWEVAKKRGILRSKWESELGYCNQGAHLQKAELDKGFQNKMFDVQVEQRRF